MKKTFISLLTIIATALSMQAAPGQSPSLREFKVTREPLRFIDERLEAVVDEQTALALKEPIPESVLRKTRPGMHAILALADALQGIGREADIHS